MYEFSKTECARRVEMLKEILAEGLARGPDFSCDCREKAHPRQAELIARIRAGDARGLDELLEIYGRCINAWARDLCHTPAAIAVFKADLVATLLTNTHELTDEDFSNQLHNTATRVAISQYQHVLEWHIDREVSEVLSNPQDKVESDDDRSSLQSEPALGLSNTTD